MELSSLEKFLQDNRTPWIVGGLTIVLFLIANLPWQLDDYDQAKQAFTSFEMVKEGAVVLSANARTNTWRQSRR